MTIRGFHHVTLIVDDHAQALWFYGKVLGLAEMPRYDFKFPGLFFHCGDQELHLIVASKPIANGPLFIQPQEMPEISRGFIHRHMALVVSDWNGLQTRLRDNRIKIAFSEETADPKDTFANNLMAGWRRMYGGVPIFCFDPSGNLLELVPGSIRAAG